MDMKVTVLPGESVDGRILYKPNKDTSSKSYMSVSF